MRLVCLLVLLVACVLPSSAAAQAWQDAYNARDYDKAAVLLHEIVTDHELALTGHDPLPARHLALLYAKGLGVTADPIAACALAQDAEMATQMSPPAKPLLTREDADRYHARLEEASAFAAGHCGALSSADVLLASQSRGGCYAFGMPEQVVSINEQFVRIGRAGIGDMDGLMCPAAVGRVRPISIEPPVNAAAGVASRHFIELLIWRVGTDQRTRVRQYIGIWRIYEVHADGVGLLTEETVHETTHWPRALLPPDFDTRLEMEMIRSGHVRWRIDGAPPRRGWLMLREAGARR